MINGQYQFRTVVSEVLSLYFILNLSDLQVKLEPDFPSPTDDLSTATRRNIISPLRESHEDYPYDVTRNTTFFIVYFSKL